MITEVVDNTVCYSFFFLCLDKRRERRETRIDYSSETTFMDYKSKRTC